MVRWFSSLNSLLQSDMRPGQPRQVVILQPGTVKDVTPNILYQLSGSFVFAQFGIPIKISCAIYEAHLSASWNWFQSKSELARGWMTTLGLYKSVGARVLV